GLLERCGGTTITVGRNGIVDVPDLVRDGEVHGGADAAEAIRDGVAETVGASVGGGRGVSEMAVGPGAGERAVRWRDGDAGDADVIPRVVGEKALRDEGGINHGVAGDVVGIGIGGWPDTYGDRGLDIACADGVGEAVKEGGEAGEVRGGDEGEA